MEEILKIYEQIELKNADIEILMKELDDPQNAEELGNINYQIGEYQKEVEELWEKLSEKVKNTDEIKEIFVNEKNIARINTQIENAEQTIEILMEELRKPENTEDFANINHEIGELQQQIDEWKKELSAYPNSLRNKEKDLITRIENANQTINLLIEELGKPENTEDLANINYEIGELQQQIEQWKKELKDVSKILKILEKENIIPNRENAIFQEQTVSTPTQSTPTQSTPTQSTPTSRGMNQRNDEEMSKQDSEILKFFHGQGDLRETTREDRRANDEFFGFESVPKRKINNPVEDKEPKKPKPQKGPGEPEPPKGSGEPEPPKGSGEPEPPKGSGEPEPPKGPGEPEPPKGPGEPEPPGTIEESKHHKKFEEIVYELESAKNALTHAEVQRYQVATAPKGYMIPYDEGDWLRNTFRRLKGVVQGLFKVPYKLYAKARTHDEQKEKMENIIENVENLSEEDFKTLIEGLQTGAGHIDQVSPALRTAATERYRREVNRRNAIRDSQVISGIDHLKMMQRKVKQIDDLLANPDLKESDKKILIDERTQILDDNVKIVRAIENIRLEASKEQNGLGLHALEEENKASREGSNVRGRKSGKRSSDNQELEAKQAALRKAQREGEETGNKALEVEAFLAHEELLEKNTSSRKTWYGITAHKSDRNHSKGVFKHSYMEDTLVQDIMTVAVGAATAINIAKQIYNQISAVQHNIEVADANVANQQAAFKGENLRQDIIGNRDVINKGIEATNDTTAASTHALGHEAAGSASNFSNGWGSTTIDKTVHSELAAGADAHLMQEYFDRGYIDIIEQYAKTHPQYDYSALLNAMKNLEAGGLQNIEAYNLAMKTLYNNAVQTGKITATQVGTVNFSPAYIETMLPLVLAGKQSSSAEYQRAERKAKRKEERAKKKEERAKKKEKWNVKPEDLSPQRSGVGNSVEPNKPKERGNGR